MTGTLTSLAALAQAGYLDKRALAGLEPVVDRYAVSVTPAMLALIDPSDPDDPVAMQFLPSSAELVSHPDETPDPIGDHVHSPVTGLVHRYPDRVLLKALHVCPVYCRFCFRREMIGPQGDGTMSADQLAAAHAYIAAHPEIWEVIITGGDPLVLSPRRIMDLIAPLREMAHVKTIRFHTRVPAVDPDRIDEALAQALASSGKATVVALHANHARELGREAEAACRRLQAHGIALVSQTVLLKGINDTVETLAELMRRFVEIGVKPYYLHHPDLSPGTSHFRLSIGNGQALMTALGGQVSGLCLPRYVLDLPGGFGKVDLMSAQVENTGPGSYRITDRHGQQHVYRDCLSSIPA